MSGNGGPCDVGAYERAFGGYRFADRQELETCTLLRLKNRTGVGTLQCYHAFPGAQLVDCRLSMETCRQSTQMPIGFLQLHYCRRGCLEIEVPGGVVSVFGAGDLVIHNPQGFLSSRMPLKHYEGLTVLLEAEKAQRALSRLFPGAGIDLPRLQSRFCAHLEPCVLHACPEIERIFEGFYQADERLRPTYAALKIVELLLFLHIWEAKAFARPVCFSKQVVQAAMDACVMLSENPFATGSAGELAARFHVASTSFRECFRSIYGQPVGAYIRTCRLRRAADYLLAHEDASIGQTAQWAGYENQSKFSAAFKGMMGQTPLQYRKHHCK